VDQVTRPRGGPDHQAQADELKKRIAAATSAAGADTACRAGRPAAFPARARGLRQPFIGTPEAAAKYLA